MEKSELYNWLSVLYLLFMTDAFSTKYIDILWIWVIIILVAGNAKRVYIMKYEFILCYIRRLLYVFPFFFALVYIEPFIFNIESIWWLIIGGVIGAFMQIPKLKDWILIWDYDIIKWNQKPDYDYLSSFVMLLCVPIGEEIFYRAFILEQANNVATGIITSALLFVLNHFGTKWNTKFRMYDLIVQIVFSIVSCYLYIASKSVFPCIVAHSFYNLPLMIYNIRGYMLCKRED